MGYLINVDEYKSIGTHLVAIVKNDIKIDIKTYFDIFGVNNVLMEISKFR